MLRNNLSSAAAAVVLLSAAASAQASIVNGNFEVGALSSWTTYTTSNGTIGTAQVVSFDTTGTGASQAVELKVGRTSFAPFSDNPPAGGGISQTFTSDAGSFSISADIASHLPLATPDKISNNSGGLFSLLLDDVVLDSFDFGSILFGTTERASLSYSGSITAGTHTLSIQAMRPFLVSDTTPLQYIDNVVLTLASRNHVPEPSAVALVGIALFGLMLSRRRMN